MLRNEEGYIERASLGRTDLLLASPKESFFQASIKT